MRGRDTKGKPPVRQPRNVGSEQSFAFRRSRTITGSAATSVRAAGESRGQLKSPRLHEHSLRKHRRRLSFYLLLSLVACGALWYVISSYIGGSVAVGTQSVQTTRTRLDTKRYQSLVAKYLSDRPFERFQFALNEEAFTQYMAAQAPEVAGARLGKGEGLGSSELALKLREPVVAWTIRNQQYFVDAEGMAFTVNYFGVPTVVVSDRSGISADAGVVASNKLLRFIGRVITLVNKSGISPVERVELPANSTREIDFKLSGKNYIIKAHLDRDPAGQAADIVSAVRYVDSKGISPAYLDVRVSSKAYYRG
jgi:hypothetical protein